MKKDVSQLLFHSIYFLVGSQTILIHFFNFNGERNKENGIEKRLKEETIKREKKMCNLFEKL